MNGFVKMIFYRLNKKLGLDLSPHKLKYNFATNYCINAYKENEGEPFYTASFGKNQKK